MKFNWKREWYVLLFIAAVVVATLVAYPYLPDPMPTHWNAAGEVDDYSSRLFGAWLVPAIMVAIYVLLFFLPRLDPRRENVERFSETYGLIRVGMTLLVGFLQIVILYSVLSGNDQLVSALIPAGVGFLFILIGNVMPRFRSNWFLGIRTPWTLSSDRVWRATHRLGGRLFMVAGGMLLLAPLLPAEWRMPLVFMAIVLSAVTPMVYSYLLYREEA